MANGNGDLQHDLCLKDIPKLLGHSEKRFLRVLAFMGVIIVLLLGLIAYMGPDVESVTPAVMQAALTRYPAPDPVKQKPEKKLVLQAKEHTRAKATKGKTAVGKDYAPYIEGTPENVEDYLRWILSHGGRLVLTKGFRPVAMLDKSLSVRPVPEGFRLPAEARNVTGDLRRRMNPLPEEATLALLIWPQQLETRLLQKLQSMQQHAARLRARYVLRQGKLEIRIQEALINGSWVPFRAKIVI